VLLLVLLMVLLLVLVLLVLVLVVQLVLTESTVPLLKLPESEVWISVVWKLESSNSNSLDGNSPPQSSTLPPPPSAVAAEVAAEVAASAAAAAAAVFESVRCQSAVGQLVVWKHSLS
jgi:hypothetical protein